MYYVNALLNLKAQLTFPTMLSRCQNYVNIRITLITELDEINNFITP